MKITQQTRKKALIKARSKMELDGVLSIYKIYEDGRKELHFKKKNVISLALKQKVLAGLYLTTTSDPITSLHIGIGGTLDPEGIYPKPVTQSLTSLYSDYLTIATSYSIDLTVPAVTFLATISQAQANSELITEAGLFTASGMMANIKTFPGVPKTSNFSLAFSWTLNIS